MKTEKNHRRFSRLCRVSYALGAGALYHLYDNWRDGLPLAVDELVRAQAVRSQRSATLLEFVRVLKNDFPKDDEVLALDDDLVQRVCPDDPTFLTYVDAAVSFKVRL
jgi:hypothetical protein